MKKIFTTLFIVLGFYSLSSAQKFAGGTEFGVNVGFNSSYISEGNTYYHSSSLTGLNVGVSADYFFTTTWSLKVKAIYDQKGWSNGYLVDNNGTEIDGINYRLNYITVPVMANWHFGRHNNWYFDFGPYIGFLTSANAGGLDVKDAFNSTDGGLAFGLGFKLPLGNGTQFFLEYEGQAGVTTISNELDGGANVLNARDSFNVGINF